MRPSRSSMTSTFAARSSSDAAKSRPPFSGIDMASK